jgi:hypothetical protein
MARAIDWTQVGVLKAQGHGDRAIARELGIPSTTFHRERQKRQGPPLSTRAGGGLGDGHRIRSASVHTGVKDVRTGPFSVNRCHTSIRPAVIVRCGSRWQGGAPAGC